MKYLKYFFTYIFFFLIISFTVGLVALVIHSVFPIRTFYGCNLMPEPNYCPAPMVHEPICRETCVTPEERNKIQLERYSPLIVSIFITIIVIMYYHKATAKQKKAEATIKKQL